MAATRNAPLQLHDTSKTISWPNSAAVSQVIPRPPAAPSGAVHMRAPAAPPALPVAAAKANPAPRIGFTPNMLQNVRRNLKRAQPRSRQQSEEPPETRQRQASPAPQTITQRQSRSRGQSAEPQEPQPLRNLLKNPMKLPANRPAASPANPTANCGCKKLDFASEKALSGILMHMTSVLTVISNQNTKLDKQSERFARMEEMQQKQGEHIMQVLSSYTRHESEIANLQNIVTSNAEKSFNFQTDLKSQLEQIGIDLADLKSSAASSRETTPPSAVSQSDNFLKLVNEKLQALMSRPSSSLDREAQLSSIAQCSASTKYEADIAKLLVKVESLPEMQKELGKIPESVQTHIKTALAPLEPVLATCTKAMEASHKQQEAQFAYFSKQGDLSTTVKEMQKDLQGLYQAEKEAAQARHGEYLTAVTKKHQEILDALKAYSTSLQPSKTASVAQATSPSFVRPIQSLTRGVDHPTDRTPVSSNASQRMLMEMDASATSHTAATSSRTPPAGKPSTPSLPSAATQVTNTARQCVSSQGEDVTRATNAPLRRRKTSLANMEDDHATLQRDSGTASTSTAFPGIPSSMQARGKQVQRTASPLESTTTSLGRRVSLFSRSSHNLLPTSANMQSTSTSMMQSARLPSKGDHPAPRNQTGILSEIARQSQPALEGSDASAFAINSQNFACLQDSQSMAPWKELSPVVSHPNIVKLSSSSDSSNSSTDSSPSSSSGNAKAKPVVKEVKMTYAKKASLKRKILQSEDDPETQEPEPSEKKPERPAQATSVANFRKSTWVKMPGLEEAASFVSLRKQKAEALHPDPDRVAHSSDTDYSDPVNLIAPTTRTNRRSTSPLTSLDSEGSSRPPSKDRTSAFIPSHSPELPEPSLKLKAPPARTVARTRRGVSGSPPPPTRRAAPKKSLKNGNPDSSTSADDSNDLDYGAVGGTKGKGKAAAQPAKKKRKTGK